MHMAVVQEVDGPAEGAGGQGAVLRVRGIAAEGDDVTGAERRAVERRRDRRRRRAADSGS